MTGSEILLCASMSILIGVAMLSMGILLTTVLG